MLTCVLEKHCTDDNRLNKVISNFWRYPAADSDVLPSNTTWMRASSNRLQVQLLGTDITGGQIPVTITTSSFSFYICGMLEAA